MSTNSKVVKTQTIIPNGADYAGRKDFKQVTVIHRDRGIRFFERVSAAVKFAHKQSQGDVLAFLVHTRRKGSVPTVLIPLWGTLACASKGCGCA